MFPLLNIGFLPFPPFFIFLFSFSFLFFLSLFSPFFPSSLFFSFFSFFFNSLPWAEFFPPPYYTPLVVSRYVAYMSIESFKNQRCQFHENIWSLESWEPRTQNKNTEFSAAANPLQAQKNQKASLSRYTIV